MGIANKIKLLGKEFLDSRLVEKILVTVPERYEASIASSKSTIDLSTITLTEVIHALQEQEQRRLMREDHEAVEGNLNYTEENALIVKKNRRSKYNKHRFFHLVPIARKKVINLIGVGGGQMSNVTNAVNWDMWKRYPKILKKMFKL